MSRLTTYVRRFDREFTELIRKRDGPKGTPELQVRGARVWIFVLPFRLSGISTLLTLVCLQPRRLRSCRARCMRSRQSCSTCA